jgi:hypothetical protein
MDPYAQERIAIEQAVATAELRMEMEEGVLKGWFYAEDDGDGNRRFGLTEEGKRAMERGELG